MRKWVASATLTVIAAFGFTSIDPIRAQQVTSSGQATSSLSVPFTTTVAGQSVPVPISGVFRITQFLEQNGRAFVAGTLAVGIGDATAPRTFVRQVIVPVLSLRSASSLTSLTLAGGPVTITPGSVSGFGTTFGTTAGTTGTTSANTTGTTGTASATTTGTSGTASTTTNGTTATTPSVAGVATAAVPGEQANCGPIRVELGPIDETQSALAFHLDRLVLEMGAPVGMTSTASSLMCSADAALAAAAGNSGGFTPTMNGAVAGVGTAPSAPAGTNANASAIGTGTPLQNVVAVLNRMLTAF